MRKRRGIVVAMTAAISSLVLTASASALVVPWTTSGTASFSGSDCGDVSDVVLGLPKGAYAVSVTGPHRGAKLIDKATGQIAATITSIRRADDGVTFTATGSDDVCSHPSRYADSGWSTKPIKFRVTSKTRTRVLYPRACNNPAYRPARVVIACGDGTFYVDHIRWSSWTGKGATGAGTGHVNDCRPSCARGRFHSYPGVTLRLGSFRFCSAHDDFEFTLLGYRFTRSRPPGFATSGFGRRGCATSARG
jgi:hypothetical protein